MRVAQFGKISTSDQIDSKSGIIFGVSVISEGEALGHDVWIDSKTLRQVKSTASTYAGGLKVKMNHYSGVESIVGTLQNFRIKESKLLADLHLLKSCDSYDRILEMAEKMPESFGLSIVFDNKPELIEKVNYARCEEIYSADLVDNPAANPSGLFEAKQKSNTMNKEILKALNLPDTATQEEYDTALLAMAKKEKMCECGKSDCKSCSGKKMQSDESEMSKKLSELSTTLTQFSTELASLKTGNANALALSKKAEIDNLMAEASRNGQVVPLESAELYEVKDGVCKIIMEPSQLSKIISRCVKGQVALSRSKKPSEAPKNEKGETFNRRTPEGREQLRVWCLEKQAANGPELARMARQEQN